MKGLKFYKDRVCLNCLTSSVENAVALYEAAEGHVALGLLSANYPDVQSAVKDIIRYQKKVDNCISVGLGSGNPRQLQRFPKSLNQNILIRHLLLGDIQGRLQERNLL